jgi:hypothetical protein
LFPFFLRRDRGDLFVTVTTVPYSSVTCRKNPSYPPFTKGRDLETLLDAKDAKIIMEDQGRHPYANTAIP